MSDQRLYKQLDRIESKVDTLDARLDSVDISLTKYNSELEVHIKRSTQIEEQLLPILRQQEQVKGAAKLIAALFAVAGAVGSLAWLWGK